MDIVEFTDEIFELLWRQLLYNIGLNQLDQQVVYITVTDILEAWQFWSLLFLALFSLLFFALLFLLLLFGQNHHIRELLFNHFVHKF